MSRRKYKNKNSPTMYILEYRGYYWNTRDRVWQASVSEELVPMYPWKRCRTFRTMAAANRAINAILQYRKDDYKLIFLDRSGRTMKHYRSWSIGKLDGN